MAVGAAVLLAGAAQAQTPRPDAGSTLRDTERLEPQAPVPVPPALKIDAAPPAAALPASGGATVQVTAVRIMGTSVYTDAALQPLVAEVVGTHADLAALQRVADRVTRYYRSNGYLLAQARLLTQAIDGGVVQITVSEGRLGSLRLDNSSGLPTPALDVFVPGKPLRIQDIERALLQLNETPGASASATLAAGAEAGTVDLLVSVKPGPKVAGEVTLGNGGSRYTGRYRLGGRLAVNNPFGIGDRLAADLSATDGDLYYGRAAYDLPVGSDGARLAFTAAHLRYELGDIFQAVDAYGTADVLGVALSYPFVRSRALSVIGSAGYQHKALKDTVLSQTVDKKADLLVGDFIVDMRDDGGSTRLAATATAGRLSIDTATALATDAATARTDGQFAKFNLIAQRSQALWGTASLYGMVQGQFSNSNLDSSEKLALGGSDGVRAYPQGEASGDTGSLLRVELRQPLAQGLTGIAFYDAGHVEINYQPWTSGNNSRSIAGYGLGLNWAGSGWFAELYAAWRAGHDLPHNDSDRSPRVWFRVGFQF